MQTYRLVPHPSTPPLEVSEMSVTMMRLMGGELLLRYRMNQSSKVVVPRGFSHRSQEDLWRRTCLELFLYDQNGRYREFNFAPAGDWAAFQFASYRKLIGDYVPEVAPKIDFQRGPQMMTVTVRLPARLLDGVKSASLCAVVEEEGGHHWLWSLTHRREEPDFHDPMSFAIRFGQSEPAKPRQALQHA